MQASAAGLASRLVPCELFGSALRGMWVILLEIGLAVGLAAFIVWWTWPEKREPEGSEREHNSDESER